jgi:hypothetical protein
VLAAKNPNGNDNGGLLFGPPFYLQKAVALGLGAKDLAQLRDTYSEFAPLRSDTEFQKLLAATPKATR